MACPGGQLPWARLASGGADSAPPPTTLRLHRGIARLGRQAFVSPSTTMAYRACVWLICADAQTPSLRENRPSHRFQVFPARPSCLGWFSPRRGGLRTPPISASRLTEACPHWATGRSLAPDRYVMPRLAYGLATRTRRPRPSEKTTPRAISGFAPVRPSRLRLAISRRGGLRTPAMTPLASPEHLPVRPPAVRLPPMIMLCLSFRTASQCGRTECIPSRKLPSVLCRCFRR